MSGIKRWDYDYLAGGPIEDAEGAYVLHSDHEAVVDSMMAALVKLDGACLASEQEVARLRAEAEGLRKDAARWQHARKLLTIDDIAERQKILEAWNNLVSDVECERADEAIDAAMGASA